MNEKEVETGGQIAFTLESEDCGLRRHQLFFLAFLLFLLAYSSVPGTVFPFWCLLQSFLIRHISGHKGLSR